VLTFGSHNLSTSSIKLEFFHSPKFQIGVYLSTLANLTLILLFSEIFKFSKIISSKSKNIVKENSEYLRIIHVLK
jgi:hypothetical protein